MTKKKDKAIRQLVKNLLCLDEESLILMKRDSETLKLRNKMDVKKAS